MCGFWGLKPWIFHFYLSFSKNPNTPQSAVRLTAPLFERGQPLREQTMVQKKKLQRNFLVLKVQIFGVKNCENPDSAFVFSAAPSRKSHQPMAPLCKGSWRGAPEGLPLKRRKTAAFCYFSVPQAPSRSRVTPSSRRKAHDDALQCHRRKKCRLSVLKPWIFHFHLRLSPNPNTPQSPAATAPLFERGQPIGVRLRCRTEKNRIAVRRIFALIRKKSVQNRSAPLPPQGSGAENFSCCNRNGRIPSVSGVFL